MRAYTADMIPGGASPVINVSQYDNDYAVTVTLIEGAEIYTPPSGATIMVEGTKPDSNGFSYACTYQGNVVTVPIYTQMTAVAGRFPIELVVYQSGLRVGSCNITLAVERAPLDSDEIISDSDIPAIIALAQAQADAAASSAASAETAKDAAMDAAQDAIDAAQELQTAIQFNAALIHETASGAVASFADGADNIPMQSVVAEITPVQSGSGDPSPTNVRPINGRTGLTIDATAANIWDGQTTVGGYYDATGAWRTDSGVLGVANAIPVRPGMQLYCHSANGAAVYVSLFSRMVTIGTSATDAFISRTRRENQSFAIPDGVECLYFNFALSYGTTYQNDVSINYPSTVQGMSPTARIIPIDWQTEAGTVYGGTLDVVSGVLTVDKGYAVYDGSEDESWNWQDGGTYKRVAIPLTDVYNPGGRVSVQSNAGTFRASGNDVGTIFASGTTLFYYPDASITSLADYKTWLASNNLQVVYPLATPQTYQITLTADKGRTLRGGNTIYTDAGGVSVEYIADTKLYIDNKIAELQALVLEN